MLNFFFVAGFTADSTLTSKHDCCAPRSGLITAKQAESPLKLVFGKWSISHVQRNLLIGSFAVNVSKPSVQFYRGLCPVLGRDWNSDVGDLVFPLPEYGADRDRLANASTPWLVESLYH